MSSREELEAAGAADWFSDSIAEQKKRNAELRSNLGQETGSLRAEKNQLQDLLQLPPDLDPEEPIPDLFASERAEVRKQSSALSSMNREVKLSRDADRELLKNLFGK